MPAAASAKRHGVPAFVPQRRDFGGQAKRWPYMSRPPRPREEDPLGVLVPWLIKKNARAIYFSGSAAGAATEPRFSAFQRIAA